MALLLLLSEGDRRQDGQGHVGVKALTVRGLRIIRVILKKFAALIHVGLADHGLAHFENVLRRARYLVLDLRGWPVAGDAAVYSLTGGIGCGPLLVIGARVLRGLIPKKRLRTRTLIFFTV